VHQLTKDQTRQDRVGSSKHTTREMRRGQEAGSATPLGPVETPGPAAPLTPAAPAQLTQTSHQALVTQGNTAANDPD
jgi:hypothetical protein